MKVVKVSMLELEKLEERINDFIVNEFEKLGVQIEEYNHNGIKEDCISLLLSVMTGQNVGTCSNVMEIVENHSYINIGTEDQNMIRSKELETPSIALKDVVKRNDTYNTLNELGLINTIKYYKNGKVVKAIHNLTEKGRQFGVCYTSYGGNNSTRWNGEALREYFNNNKNLVDESRLLRMEATI